MTTLTAVEIGMLIKHSHLTIDQVRELIPTITITSRKRAGRHGRTVTNRLGVPSVGERLDDNGRMVKCWSEDVMVLVAGRPGMGNRLRGESKRRAANARWGNAV